MNFFTHRATTMFLALLWGVQPGCSRHTPPRAEAPSAEAAREQLVSFPSGDLRLQGLLTIPERLPDARLPAIVLVHGSGPQSRDVVLPLNFPRLRACRSRWGTACRRPKLPQLE